MHLYLGQETSGHATGGASKQEPAVFYYLNQKNDEEIEVGYPSELLEQVLWDKIPNCVLKEKEKNAILEQAHGAALQTAAVGHSLRRGANGEMQAWPSAWRRIDPLGFHLIDTGQ